MLLPARKGKYLTHWHGLVRGPPEPYRKVRGDLTQHGHALRAFISTLPQRPKRHWLVFGAPESLHGILPGGAVLMATITSPLGAAQDLPSLRLALRPLPDVAALRKIFGVAGPAPFVLARQTFPAPRAVIPRVVPGHHGHRLLRRSWRKGGAVPMVRRHPACRQDELLVLAMRHFCRIELLGGSRSTP